MQIPAFRLLGLLRGKLARCRAGRGYGFGDYGLGYGIPMSGYTPPPGVYFSDTFYLYSASATTNVTFHSVISRPRA
jgi:hypothetical protein